MRRTQRLPLETLAPYLLDVPEPAAPIAWPNVFGNQHPVEIEIGFGKGLFLLSASQASSKVNFLGVDVMRKYQLFTATRLVKRGTANVRLVKADARLFLRDCIAAASVQAIHVYFPDPWWKKRHLKRRVFTADFAMQCERVLRTGGRLYVVTDVAEYFSVMTDLLARHTQLQALPLEEQPEPRNDLDYLTNFDRKFRKEGRPIHRGVYER
jgi:tRNA (guanine-N7-)-methyltransferase